METLKNKTTKNVENSNVENSKTEFIISPEMQEDLNKLNLESLTKKTTKNSGFWSDRICSRYGFEFSKENKKKARTLSRREQISLSNALLASFKTKVKQKESLQNLYNFYFDTLTDLNNFSNISKKENPEDYSSVQKAHKLMNENILFIELK